MYYTEEQQPQQQPQQIGDFPAPVLQSADQHLMEYDEETKKNMLGYLFANAESINKGNQKKLAMMDILQQQYQKDMEQARAEYDKAVQYETAYNNRAFQLQKQQNPERFSNVKDFADPEFLQKVQYYMRDENGDITSYNPGRATMRQVQPPKMTGLQMQSVRFPAGRSGSGKDPVAHTVSVNGKNISNNAGIVSEAVSSRPAELQPLVQQVFKPDVMNPKYRVFDKLDTAKVFGESAGVLGVGEGADAQTMAFAVLADGVTKVKGGEGSDSLALLKPLVDAGASVHDANGNANFRIPKPKKRVNDADGNQTGEVEIEASNVTDLYDVNSKDKAGGVLHKNYKNHFNGLLRGASQYIYNSPMFQDPILRKKILGSMKDKIVVNGKEELQSKEETLYAAAEMLAAAAIYRASGILVIGDKGLPSGQPQQQARAEQQIVSKRLSAAGQQQANQ